ncbi:hypothetical protein H6S82_31600 [Planktothrix sp. FACHB-1355]|uniref:Uncharacterized protein n=1 Tax=Aerosakkonema funiforme FACHB-1375 TaxID=2949571 RepID=A0A926ZL45_9CYAN|nr:MULTISPECIES: hypothetical protein [Oscillatoriales]MBD2186022.1 hypothetical protein [Aerosakkonema funiforme FACHB-1375]MBD3563349.1 hypothetical protein [Planktothrix sp. FACHB-1355]
MTIETLNATLFPAFLFIVFFSTACCFFYTPTETNRNHQSTVFTASSESKTITAKSEISCPSSSSSTVENPETLAQKPPALEPNRLIPEAITINTQLINLRQARKIASAIKKANPSLGIPQRVNGSNASVEWLRIQIKNRLEQASELVTPIILELAPAASAL